jgi:O-antigen/teichoic acid export membrane protein
VAVQHQALLKRQMRFEALAAVEISSVLAGIVAGVSAAVAGLGCWALVIMQLVTAATLAVGVWRACRWRPARPTRGAGVRSMLVFGGNLAATSVLDGIRLSFQQVMLGRFCGAGPLGLYSKAYQLLLLPTQQINTPMSNVAIPTLSRLQDDPDQYRGFYRRGLQIMASLGMPISVFMFVAAEDVVLAVLGDQWRGSVGIFRMLAPATFVGSFNMATGWPYVSLGHTARQLRWVALATMVVVAATMVGLRWGAIGVAAAYSIVVCGLRLPGILYCIKVTPITLADVFGVLWRPAAAAVAAGVLLHALDKTVQAEFVAIIRLAIDVLIYGVGYSLCWLLLPKGPRIARDILSLLSLLRDSPEGATPLQSE